MGGIQDNDVNMGVCQSSHTVQNIGGDAYAGAAEKASLGILCGIRVLDLLLNILDGDESAEIVILVDDGELLHLRLGQNLLRILHADAHRCRHQVLAGHAVPDQLAVILFKLQIAVGDDAHQLPVLGDRHAGNPELAHQLVRIAERMLRRE